MKNSEQAEALSIEDLAADMERSYLMSGSSEVITSYKVDHEGKIKFRIRGTFTPTSPGDSYSLNPLTIFQTQKYVNNACENRGLRPS